MDTWSEHTAEAAAYHEAAHAAVCLWSLIPVPRVAIWEAYPGVWEGQCESGPWPDPVDESRYILAGSVGEQLYRGLPAFPVRAPAWGCDLTLALGVLRKACWNDEVEVQKFVELLAHEAADVLQDPAVNRAWHALAEALLGRCGMEESLTAELTGDEALRVYRAGRREYRQPFMGGRHG